MVEGIPSRRGEGYGFVDMSIDVYKCPLWLRGRGLGVLRRAAAVLRGKKNAIILRKWFVKNRKPGILNGSSIKVEFKRTKPRAG